MKQNLKEEIEAFVQDWHWDEKSRVYAFEMGKFLFSFMDYLKDKGLSERVLNRHLDNVFFIGVFESGYGHNDTFEPENLADGPGYLHVYTRKVSDSEYAIQSWEATWRKLDKYIKSGEYVQYLKRLEANLKQA